MLTHIFNKEKELKVFHSIDDSNKECDLSGKWSKWEKIKQKPIEVPRIRYLYTAMILQFINYINLKYNWIGQFFDNNRIVRALWCIEQFVL